MSVYLIADIKVTDESWVPEYAANAHKLVHRHGGRYLARSGNVRIIEGTPPATTLIALIEFPSAAEVEAFLADNAYQPYAKARQAGSVSCFRLIDDSDLAGTIPYLRRPSDAAVAAE